jgi:hypothetical protein
MKIQAFLQKVLLLELWQGRRAFYPPDRPDLLSRFLLEGGDRLRLSGERVTHVNVEGSLSITSRQAYS